MADVSKRLSPGERWQPAADALNGYQDAADYVRDLKHRGLSLTYVRKNANIVREERMAETQVVFYRDKDGTVPVLDWFECLNDKAQAKCLVRIERLRKLGHELRRPEADYLRDGIYELRIGLQGIHYRILYFFHGRTAAVLSHGLVKERAVPHREIELALRRKRRFEDAPKSHTHSER